MPTDTQIAKESGHWYDRDGSPRYTIVGKNGKERPTNLSDARKNGWLPSVTTVTKMLAKPGLERWIKEQVLMAALTLPQLENETADAYAERVMKDADEQSQKAMAAGTDVHADIEDYIAGKPHKYPSLCGKIKEAMEAAGINIMGGNSEHSFAHRLGYAGKVDWHSTDVVVDFKTKDKIKNPKTLAYDEHVMQLAAYAQGLFIERPRLFNVFVGITDGQVIVHHWDVDEIARATEMFNLTLKLWQVKNDYHPTW